MNEYRKVYDPATIIPLKSFEIESFDDTVRINCPIPTVGKIMKAVQFNRNYTDLDSAHHKVFLSKQIFHHLRRI